MMRFAKVAPGQPIVYPYTLDQMRADHPHTSLPWPLDAAALEFLGAAVVERTDPPAQASGMTVEEAAPEFVGGAWRQVWAVREATPAELAARVPQAVTMRQARRALHASGLLAGIEAAIDALPEPQRTAARIEWDYSNEVQRHNGFVAALAPALSLTEQQLDELFVLAATL